MMEVKMNIYHCMDPRENPVPAFLKPTKKTGPKQPDYQAIEQERVRKFKESPGSFFPPFYGRPKP